MARVSVARPRLPKLWAVILLVMSLYATLIAQTAWALTIHVTPTASPQTTLYNLPSLAGGESAASGVHPTEGEGASNVDRVLTRPTNTHPQRKLDRREFIHALSPQP